MFARMRKKRNSRGQIAIFLLLIFQLLFILFAMTLNIALTVHDKINLQNSVDLAAIYGSKKQAEVLNAIAHINYQMRQNYKLLAWRYRILGSMAQNLGGLGDIGGLGAQDPSWCPKPKSNPPPRPYSNYRCTEPYNLSSPHYLCDSDPYPGYCDANFTVCLSADIWQRGISNSIQNFCTNQQVVISTPQPVTVIFPIGPNFAAAASQLALVNNAASTCRGEGVINWVMTHLFLSQFRLDQKDRKMMIRAIYKATLEQGRDLEGQSIKKGAIKTLEKNLTWVNKQNFSPAVFQDFNPLDTKEFDDSDPLLKPLNVFPVLEYLHFPSNNGWCNNTVRTFSNDRPQETNPPFINGNLPNEPVVNQYRVFINQWKDRFKLNTYSPNTESFITPLTLGYVKNPDVRVYYGVSVQLPHQSVHQLFSPFEPNEPLTLKASAFAKPFGGRIGPSKDADPLIKPQIEVLTSGVQAHPWNLKPNYSRFPGDRWGLIHKEAHTQYYLQKQENWPSSSGPNPFSVNYYADLTNRDPLVANVPGPSGGNPLFILRMMELMAVSPDLFDVLNYSISNNYMDTYFPKICKLISQGGNDCNPNQIHKINFGGSPPVEGHIRGDFGYPHTARYVALNKDHVSNPSPLSPFFFFPGTQIEYQLVSHHPHFNVNHGWPVKPPYLIRDPAHLLTGFMPTTSPDRYTDYNAPGANPSMKCYEPTPDGQHIPSGCAVGGRSGYSVKLISCDVVRSLPSATATPDIMDIYCK